MRAVILFSGDAARDEREKGLPRHFLSRIAGSLASTIASMPDVDLIVADAAHAFRNGGGSLLGTCIAEHLSRAFAAGYSQVAVIAGDVPGLTRAHIERAFTLECGAHGTAFPVEPKAAARPPHSRTVIGPSRDGGFYLAAFDRLPEIDWTSLPWCTSSIFDALHRAVPSAEVLEVLDDVDSLDDARRVARLFPVLKSLLRLTLPIAHSWCAPRRRTHAPRSLRAPPLPIRAVTMEHRLQPVSCRPRG